MGSYSAPPPKLTVTTDATTIQGDGSSGNPIALKTNTPAQKLSSYPLTYGVDVPNSILGFLTQVLNADFSTTNTSFSSPLDLIDLTITKVLGAGKSQFLIVVVVSASQTSTANSVSYRVDFAAGSSPPTNPLPNTAILEGNILFGIAGGIHVSSMTKLKGGDAAGTYTFRLSIWVSAGTGTLKGIGGDGGARTYLLIFELPSG